MIGNPSVFELSILQRLDASLADETAQEIHPGMLFAMARSAELDLERRIEVAEEAVALGVLPAADLGRLYSQVEIPEADLAAFRSRAVEWDGSRARALRYQAAMADAATPKDQADMIAAALDAAASPQDYLAVARLYEPLLLILEPTAELSDFTGTAGQALFALGRFKQAEAWMGLARQEAMKTPTAAAAVTALWPYARLAGVATVPWDGDLNAWISANQGAEPSALSSRVALLQVTLRALGGGGPLDWSEIAASTDDTATEVPDASMLFALDGASGSGRLGETVLLSLLVLGKAGPGGSHLLALERVLTALSNVGLEREAPPAGDRGGAGPRRLNLRGPGGTSEAESRRFPAGRGLPGDAGRRARRPAQHPGRLPARPRTTSPTSSAAAASPPPAARTCVPTWRASAAAGCRRGRRPGGSRPCGSSTSSSMPRACAMTIRPPRSTARARAVACPRC